MKRILISLVVISAVLVFVINTSGAYFSDTESSIDNILEAGAFDLTVNGQNNPQAIVEITDLKPGDNKLIRKELFIENPAYVFLHIKDIVSEQGEQTEPEEEEEALNGVKFDLENYMVYDLKVIGEPDDVIVDFGDNNTFWQMHSCWIPLGIIPGGVTTIVEQSFHFPSDITNWAQGDKMTFTEEFYAQQVRNNETPTPPDTDSGRVWSEEIKACVSDFSGIHNIVFTCTSGCSGDYPHTMNITSMDTATGNFSGTGSYDPNNSVTWNVAGNSIGPSINFDLVYTGLNPGYTVTANGTLAIDGTSSGVSTSSTGQTFTWTAN